MSTPVTLSDVLSADNCPLLAFPRTKTTEDEHIEDLVVSSVVRSFDAHVDSPPIEVRRADMSYMISCKCLHMRISQVVRSEKNLGKTTGSRLGDTRIPPLKAKFRS